MFCSFSVGDSEECRLLRVSCFHSPVLHDFSFVSGECKVLFRLPSGVDVTYQIYYCFGLFFRSILRLDSTFWIILRYESNPKRRLQLSLDMNREFKINDATVATTPQNLHT